MFIRGRWVQSGAHWGSLDSSGVVGYTRVCPWGHWVHPWSLGSIGCALRVVGFIPGRYVHSSAPLGSLGSSGVVRFTCVRPVGRWVYSGAPWPWWS